MYAHYQLIGLVLKEFAGHQPFDVCAFQYDETSKAALMQAGWESFKAKNPNWGKHAATLAPLDDKVHVPIQVADLLAYTTTKVYESASAEEAKIRGEQHLKSWLKKHLIRVAYADADYLRAIVAGNIERIKVFKSEHPDGIVL